MTYKDITIKSDQKAICKIDKCPLKIELYLNELDTANPLRLV